MSNRLKTIQKDLEEGKDYSVEEVINLIQSHPKLNFKESIDVAIRLGVDPQKSDQNMRGALSLPSGSGKPCRVAVFVDGDLADKARKAGADKVGMEDLVDSIKSGEINYDVIVATPDTMKLVSPLGKQLGPKGLMPNPKEGTVTKDVVKAVELAKAGQIRYRSDKNGIIHGRIGDITYSGVQIKENLETLLIDLKKNKPASAKGIFIKKVSLSSTMGPGFSLDMSTLNF
jgi:large subunit ribosomal protein L1